MNIFNIFKLIKRNPCEECDYYNTPNNPKGYCQSKKVCNNGYGKVIWIDRMFCEPYKADKGQKYGKDD